MEIWDFISVNTFWTILLIVHGLLAIALLGALTHQAVAVLMPVRQVAGGPDFVTRLRAVASPAYATAVCVLWVLTLIMGAWIYTKYRIYVRIPIEQAGHWKTQGLLRTERACRDASASACCRSTGTSGRTRRSRHTTARAIGLTVVLALHLLVQFHRRSRRQQRPGVWIMMTDITTATAIDATTATAKPAATPSSLATSARFKTFAVMFALVSTLMYLACEWFNLPVFTYHPATNRVGWWWEAGRSGEGPAMYWYGWTAMTLAVGAVAGLLGTLLPEACLNASRCSWSGCCRFWYSSPWPIR